MKKECEHMKLHPDTTGEYYTCDCGWFKEKKEDSTNLTHLNK